MSSRPLVSLVLTTHNRPNLLAVTLESLRRQEFADYEIVVVNDGTETEWTRLACSAFGVEKYIERTRDPIHCYSNPAIPNNIGIRAAEGKYLIIQNAECRHAPGREIIGELVKRTTANNAVIAGVRALDANGRLLQWYTHSKENPRPFFFCGCIERRHMVELRGFDEDYLYYGMDDVDMADRLYLKGVRFEYHDDILIDHQWHPSSHVPGDPTNNINQEIYRLKTAAMAEGKLGIVRNLHKEWGQL